MGTCWWCGGGHPCGIHGRVPTDHYYGCVVRKKVMYLEELKTGTQDFGGWLCGVPLCVPIVYPSDLSLVAPWGWIPLLLPPSKQASWLWLFLTPTQSRGMLPCGSHPGWLQHWVLLHIPASSGVCVPSSVPLPRTMPSCSCFQLKAAARPHGEGLWVPQGDTRGHPHPSAWRRVEVRGHPRQVRALPG